MAVRTPAGRAEAHGCKDLDQFIGPHENQWRQIESHGHGRLEIDEESEFRRLLQRRIGWVRAVENLGGIMAGEPSGMPPVLDARIRPPVGGARAARPHGFDELSSAGA
jgi:hypothetical protein